MWKKHNDDLVIVCDIGSAMVAASFVVFSKDPKIKPKILYTTFVPMSILEEPDFSKLEDLISTYATQAFTTLSKEGLVELHSKGIDLSHVQSIHVSLASPWFSSKTVKRTFNEKNTFVFDDTLIKTILNEEERTFETEMLEKGMVYDTGKDIRMIEREVIGVSLNGYPTHDPLGRSAKVADLSLYMSLAPEKVLNSVRTAAADHFHLANVVFHSFPFVSYTALEKLFPHELEYVFFDVAGESTDIFMVEKGSITGTVSFPLGRNALVRALKLDHGSEEMALSALSLVQGKAVDGTSQGEIEVKLAPYASYWKKSCADALEKLTLGHSPKIWFVIADEVSETLFSSYLRSIAEAEGKTATIISVDHAHLDPHVEMEKHVERDRFLALQVLFLNIHGNR